MAWTDQCKIAAVQTIDKVAEKNGVSVKEAIAAVSRDVDIPSSTLQRWYYPRAKSEVINDPTMKNDEETVTNEELEKLEKKQHGGTRKGSGRKPKDEPEITSPPDEEPIKKEQPSQTTSKRNKPAVVDERVTEGFTEAYNRMVGAIQNEREDSWSKMTKETALKHADALVQILTYGK